MFFQSEAASSSVYLNSYIVKQDLHLINTNLTSSPNGAHWEIRRWGLYVVLSTYTPTEISSTAGLGFTI